MSSGIRKGQLVTTFGVGAMHVDSNGVSLMTCGLDHWFEEQSSMEIIENPELYRLDDHRLADRLGVSHFMAPPDAKTPPINHDGNSKTLLRTPLMAVRFPKWHVCSNQRCQRMTEAGASWKTSPKCDKCQSRMYQSRFVVVCDHGHIDDFPWADWVHRSLDITCGNDKLKLQGGGGSLASMRVRCEACGKTRSMAGIMIMENDTSNITKNLLKGDEYRCRGGMPWLGNSREECDRPIVGILRQATNVYFSKLVSSIHLPVNATPDISHIVDLLESDEKLVDVIDQVQALDPHIRVNIVKTQDKCPLAVSQCSDADILKAMEIVIGVRKREEISEPDSENEFRRQERELLLKHTDRLTLKTTPLDIGLFEPWMADYFSDISIITKLTETRAMVGFDRLAVNGEKTLDQYKSQLRKIAPGNKEENWLPALRVYGEGIYLELRKDVLKRWIERSDVQSRADLLVNKVANNQFIRRESISPTFLLLHTLSHLLMNRLVFDCGYSSAALRERIYESDDEEYPIAGLLIYTASGDSEGSLGGLVAKGRPRQLEPIISSALAEAQWCSSDPVCTESGTRGQGPGSLNLAACHSCALVPETSCETMNMFLDRSCVISHGATGEGFFDSLDI